MEIKHEFIHHPHFPNHKIQIKEKDFTIKLTSNKNGDSLQIDSDSFDEILTQEQKIIYFKLVNAIIEFYSKLKIEMKIYDDNDITLTYSIWNTNSYKEWRRANTFRSIDMLKTALLAVK